MANAAKRNRKDNAPTALKQVSPQDAPLKVGDHCVDFDGIPGQTPTSVVYKTIVNGPNKRGQYLIHEQGYPVPDDSDFDLWCRLGNGTNPRLTPAQWAQCEAAGFPKAVSDFLAALGSAPTAPTSETVTFTLTVDPLRARVFREICEEERTTPEQVLANKVSRHIHDYLEQVAIGQDPGSERRIKAVVDMVSQLSREEAVRIFRMEEWPLGEKNAPQSLAEAKAAAANRGKLRAERYAEHDRILAKSAR